MLMDYSKSKEVFLNPIPLDNIRQNLLPEDIIDVAAGKLTFSCEVTGFK
jgi:hypothetical protein